MIPNDYLARQLAEYKIRDELALAERERLLRQSFPHAIRRWASPRHWLLRLGALLAAGGRLLAALGCELETRYAEPAALAEASAGPCRG